MLRLDYNSNVKAGSSILTSKYFILLGTCLFLLGHNEFLDVILMLFILVMLILNLNGDNFIISYFPFVFFEPVLTLPVIGGSFFRIYQLLFITRLIIDFYTGRKFFLSNKLNILAGIVYLMLSFTYTQNFEQVISSFVNITIIIYMVTYKSNGNYLSYLNEVFAVVGIFSVLSGISGLLLLEPINFGYTLRFSGLIGDPNYSSLLYILGIFSVLGTYSLNRRQKIILISSLIILLISTVSISGILGALLLLTLYISVVNKNKSILYILVIILIGILFMNLNFEQGSSLYGIQFRIDSILASTSLDSLTSNRSSLAKDYYQNFMNLPIKNQLFGGKNVISGPYRDEMVNTFGGVSHNSFIDMIYLTGFFGAFSVLIIFTMLIISTFKKYLRTNNKIYLSLSFLKVTLLYFATNISIFTFRYFYLFFIL